LKSIFIKRNWYFFEIFACIKAPETSSGITTATGDTS